jgi:hypothetical protein
MRTIYTTHNAIDVKRVFALCLFGNNGMLSECLVVGVSIIVRVVKSGKVVWLFGSVVDD